jgi:hypothetical protein
VKKITGETAKMEETTGQIDNIEFLFTRNQFMEGIPIPLGGSKSRRPGIRHPTNDDDG